MYQIAYSCPCGQDSRCHDHGSSLAWYVTVTRTMPWFTGVLTTVVLVLPLAVNTTPSASGIPTTWTRPDDFVHHDRGVSLPVYIRVWSFRTDLYWHIPLNTKQAWHIPVCTVSKKRWFFNCWGFKFAFLSNHACILSTLPTYSKTHPYASSAKRSMFWPVELKLGTYMYIEVYTSMISTSSYILWYTLANAFHAYGHLRLYDVMGTCTIRWAPMLWYNSVWAFGPGGWLSKRKWSKCAYTLIYS